MAKPTEEQRLKKFGLTMSICFALVTLLMCWKCRHTGVIVCTALSIIFFALGMVAPMSLKAFEKFWLILGEKIGKVVAYVVLSALFFVFVTPFAFLLRAMGKDLLGLKNYKKPGLNSYWIDCENSTNPNRYYVPY